MEEICARLPLEIRQEVLGFLHFFPRTKDELQRAVDAWCSRNAATRAQAQRRYGHISTWITSAITDMCYMFSGARAFNGNISAWNTASVTNMSGMFRDAHTFNGNISAWNTASVTIMYEMFDGATAYNGDIPRRARPP